MLSFRPPGSFKSFEEVARWLGQLEQEIVNALNEPVQLVEQHSAPAKPISGGLYFADGTDWDPGSGRGIYAYDFSGPTWRFLG